MRAAIGHLASAVIENESPPEVTSLLGIRHDPCVAKPSVPIQVIRNWHIWRNIRPRLDLVVVSVSRWQVYSNRMQVSQSDRCEPVRTRVDVRHPISRDSRSGRSDH